jgi:hypothetical protein
MVYSLRRFSASHLDWDDLDGGGPGISFYYLIIKGDAAVNVEQEQHFYRTALTEKNDWFIFIDIGCDFSLRDHLAKLPGGPELYSTIEQQAPIVLSAPRPIIDMQDVATIKVRQITDYYADLEYIYKRLSDIGSRSNVIESIKRFNSYAQLKPSLFGIGININEMLSDVIKRWENNNPSRR